MANQTTDEDLNQSETFEQNQADQEHGMAGKKGGMASGSFGEDTDEKDLNE